ncbi:MAG: HNH endonuclease [Desulfurispora sp.]|uniref:HNH endonuclease n=1 Tax=Desulfurispora sp. TaxID=3014275 RepID=UPI00404992FF
MRTRKGVRDGGKDTIENTVALCPNCHRKMHSLNLPEDKRRLQQAALKILNNSEN